MKTLTETDIAWRRGFEAGVAYSLQRFTSCGANPIDIFKFICELELLRPWKSHEEWSDFVTRNNLKDVDISERV